MSTALPGASAPDGRRRRPTAPRRAETDEGTGFKVNLANFTGPFDLLLQLIGKHKLDVTEVALHTVTDEFIAYIRAMGDDWDLDEVSEFLVVASTLLDLKAARLLPSAAVEDEEDLALLEARDLLFARLLQYKAYQGGGRLPRAARAHRCPALAASGRARAGVRAGPAGTRPRHRPAATARPRDQGDDAEDRPDHRHLARAHGAGQRPRARGDAAGRAAPARQWAHFGRCAADCKSTLEIVARFLALLELYREGLVAFDQVQALGELTVRWIGPTDAPIELDIDEYAGSPAETAPVVPVDAAVVAAVGELLQAAVADPAGLEGFGGEVSDLGASDDGSADLVGSDFDESDVGASGLDDSDVGDQDGDDDHDDGAQAEYGSPAAGADFQGELP